MRTPLLAAALCIGTSPLALAGSAYVLVSCSETPAAEGARPCIVYGFEEEGGLTKMHEFAPRNGISLVAAVPKLRKVVAWGYDPGAADPVSVVDIDRPEKSLVFHVPDCVMGSGQVIRFGEGDIRLVMTGAPEDGFSPQVLSLTTGTLSRTRREDVPWGNAYIYASSGMRGKHHCLLLVYRDEEGQFFTYAGEHVSSRPLSLELSDEVRHAAKGIDVQTAGIGASDDTLCLITIAGPDRITGQPAILRCCYDRRNHTWRMIEPQATHTSLRIQSFSPWLVWQTCPPPEARNDPASWTGDFTLLNIDADRRTEWQAGPSTEILGIWESIILFRRRTVLFEAKLTRDGVEAERTLYDGPELTDVHWAFQGRRSQALGGVTHNLHPPTATSEHESSRVRTEVPSQGSEVPLFWGSRARTSVIISLSAGLVVVAVGAWLLLRRQSGG